MSRPADETPLAIDWEHFAAVDMRVGRVLEVADFPEARVPAWKLRLVVAVVNFPPKRIGPFLSEVLVLGALDDDKGVVLLAPDSEVEPGDRIA
jgi:tRNA-binding protein